MDGMLARMPAHTLAEWRDYYEIEPWGATRDNIHAGIIASVVANANRGKGTKPFTHNDFMLRHREERKRAGVMSLYHALKSMSNNQPE